MGEIELPISGGLVVVNDKIRCNNCGFKVDVKRAIRCAIWRGGEYKCLRCGSAIISDESMKLIDVYEKLKLMEEKCRG